MRIWWDAWWLKQCILVDRGRSDHELEQDRMIPLACVGWVRDSISDMRLPKHLNDQMRTWHDALTFTEYIPVDRCTSDHEVEQDRMILSASVWWLRDYMADIRLPKPRMIKCGLGMMPENSKYVFLHIRGDRIMRLSRTGWSFQCAWGEWEITYQISDYPSTWTMKWGLGGMPEYSKYVFM